MELLQKLTLFQCVVITGLDALYNGLFADCQTGILQNEVFFNTAISNIYGGEGQISNHSK